MRIEETYVNGCITASKCKDASNSTDEERQSLRRKFSKVQELCKHFFGTSVVGHIGQGDQNRKESQNVQHQDHSLKSRENFSSHAVDNDGKGNNRPE